MSNILQMLRMAKNGNPRDIVMNMVKNNNNPIMQQLIDYAEQGKYDEIETFARNYAKEHNIDFDKEFNSVQSILKNLK